MSHDIDTDSTEFMSELTDTIMTEEALNIAYKEKIINAGKELAKMPHSLHLQQYGDFEKVINGLSAIKWMCGVDKSIEKWVRFVYVCRTINVDPYILRENILGEVKRLRQEDAKKWLQKNRK